MKKQEISKIRQMSIKDLDREVAKLVVELAKDKLEFSVNVPKDTNALVKKRKRLAVIKTIVWEKKIAEKFEKKDL